MSIGADRVEVEASCFSLSTLTCSDEALLEISNKILHYLGPIADGRSNTVKTVAREHSSTIQTILKACSAWMDANQGKEAVSKSTKRNREAVSDVACSALDTIDFIRPALKAAAADLNAQRYSVARKMLGMASYRHALQTSLALRRVLAATDVSKDEMKAAATVSILTCLAHEFNIGVVAELLPDLHALVDSGSKHSQSILAFSSKARMIDDLQQFGWL